MRSRIQALVLCSALSLVVPACSAARVDVDPARSRVPDTPTAEAQARARAQLASSPWAEHAGKVPFVLGYDQGVRAAKESGRPPMYFFTTSWCGWCKKLAHEAFADDEVAALIDREFTPVLVDGDTEKTVVRRFGVSGFPKLVFSGPNGAVLLTVDGYRPREEVLRAARAASEALRKAASTPEQAVAPDRASDRGSTPVTTGLAGLLMR